MEQNNELNQNQTSIPEFVPTESVEAVSANTPDQNLEIFKQNILADIEAKIEQKLSQLSPKDVAEDKGVLSPQEEIAALKNKIQQMEKIQQALTHHDLGFGQINHVPNLDRTKTLKEHLEENLLRG